MKVWALKVVFMNPVLILWMRGRIALKRLG